MKEAQEEPPELPIRRPQGLLTVRSSILRGFCSAFIMPTVSAGLGLLFFDRVRPVWARWVCGYLTYMGVRSVFSLVYRYELLWQRANRQVLDYGAEGTEAAPAAGGGAAGAGAGAQAAAGAPNPNGNAVAQQRDRQEAAQLVQRNIELLLQIQQRLALHGPRAPGLPGAGSGAGAAAGPSGMRVVVDAATDTADFDAKAPVPDTGSSSVGTGQDTELELESTTVEPPTDQSVYESGSEQDAGDSNEYQQSEQSVPSSVTPVEAAAGSENPNTASASSEPEPEPVPEAAAAQHVESSPWTAAVDPFADSRVHEQTLVAEGEERGNTPDPLAPISTQAPFETSSE